MFVNQLVAWGLPPPGQDDIADVDIDDDIDDDDIDDGDIDDDEST
jgi:hypothetical protein